jgi:hypothetical protein
MTLEEIYYISQVVAAAAVIASLIYLAIQTRQAARSSRAAMHENRVATILRHVDKQTEAAFSEIWFKGNTGAADMTDDEVRRYTLQVAGMVIMWEERFRQKKEGMLDQSRWAASENSIMLLTQSSGFRAVVTLVRPRMDPDFGAIMDKYVAIGRAAPVVDQAAMWRAAVAHEAVQVSPSAT